MQQTLIFRQIENRDELHQIIKLRYDSYLNSSMKNFLEINESGIDVDIYDIHSKHFGLFVNAEPYGYLRFIYPRDMIYNKHIYSIGRAYGLFRNDLYTKKNQPEYPFLQYLSVPDSIQKFMIKVKKENTRLIEVSRLMLFKNKGIGKLKFIVECALASGFWAWCDFEEVIINCDKNHSCFYSHYGFREITKSERYYLNGRNKPSCLLSLSNSKEQIPISLLGRLELLAEEYKANRQITLKIN